MTPRTFVGFGFGPIQSGLMLLEARNSGCFDRYVVAEIAPPLVDAVRADKGRATVNVARRDGIVREILENIEILNPQVAADRARIVEAVRDAAEMATALPSVHLFDAGGPASVAAILAKGVHPDKRQILYACENDNYAAEILTRKIEARGETRLTNFQALNTVIGKMSGAVQDPEAIRRLGLAPLTSGAGRAVLVEEFNRILISRVRWPDFPRGIAVFEEKDDLLPFEEAKLFGHNAIHALLGYLAFHRGRRVMSEVRNDRDLMDLARQAFLRESGAALVRKHGATDDPLFTAAGFAAYADDLLERMTNPWLNDEIERVCRDPRRKLGFSDRLVGAMREVRRQGIEPSALALGVAAALGYAAAQRVDLGIGAERYPTRPADLTENLARDLLLAVWGDDPRDAADREFCLSAVCGRLPAFRRFARGPASEI